MDTTGKFEGDNFKRVKIDENTGEVRDVTQKEWSDYQRGQDLIYGD